MPDLLTGPTALILLTLGVHAAGRIVALNGGSPGIDSYTYAINAYKLYNSESVAGELVTDKPAGQALLTGWVYLLWPGRPSRLPLIPVEAFFMLGALAVFGLLAARYFGARIAAALALFLAIGQNIYNALDFTTDGFNLNENYLALPIIAAMYAHLHGGPAWRRGLLRGLGLGVALTIKQTAVAGLLAVLVHDLVRLAARREGVRSAAIAAASTAVGIVLGFLPLVGFLAARGWLFEHGRLVLTHSAPHVGWMRLGLLPLNLLPLLPLLWWIGLPALAVSLDWLRGRAPAEPERARTADLFAFALIWFVAEMVMIWMMIKPSSHYHQQVIAPLALLAGCGIARLTLMLERSTLDAAQRRAAWRWLMVTAAVLAITAALPLFPEAHKRARTWKIADEPEVFQREMAAWRWGTAAERE